MQFWNGQGCPLFDFVYPAFPLLTTASPTVRGALPDGVREVVVARGIPYRARVSPWSVAVARLGSCGPACQLTSLRTQSLYSETKRQRTGFVVVVTTP